MTGMTMEVLGTLVGAAIQGQIVASAHTLKHCPTSNMSAGYLGNSSGAEIVKSLVHSKEYLSHAVSITVPSQEARCAKSRPRRWSEMNFQLNLVDEKVIQNIRGWKIKAVASAKEDSWKFTVNRFLHPKRLRVLTHGTERRRRPLISEPRTLSQLPTHHHKVGGGGPSSLTSDSKSCPIAPRGLHSLQVIRPIYVSPRAFEATLDTVCWKY